MKKIFKWLLITVVVLCCIPLLYFVVVFTFLSLTPLFMPEADVSQTKLDDEISQSNEAAMARIEHSLVGFGLLNIGNFLIIENRVFKHVSGFDVRYDCIELGAEQTPTLAESSRQYWNEKLDSDDELAIAMWRTFNIVNSESCLGTNFDLNDDLMSARSLEFKNLLATIEYRILVALRPGSEIEEAQTVFYNPDTKRILVAYMRKNKSSSLSQQK